MASTPRRPSSTGVVLLLLLAALAVGAAASIAAAARTANSPPIPGTPVSEVYLSDQVVILGCLLLFLAIVVPLVYDRLRGGSALPGKAVAVSLVVVLALVIFVVVARSAGIGGAPLSLGSGTVPPNNDTNSTVVPFNNNTTTTPLGNGGTISVWGLHAPAWLLFPAIAIVGALVAVVAVPRIRLYLQDRAVERASLEGDGDGVRGALERAAEELAEGGDARAVILRLYARLLGRVEPIIGSVERSTPEEIRTAHLVRVGIRPEAAEALTRLFEEARYSTHPLGPGAAARAAQAISEAEHDLARGIPLP